MHTIDLLRNLWYLHVDNILLPRSSSYEFFVTCLTACFAPSPNFVEYGPFTGATSAILTSISSSKGGHTYLVDNWQQMTTRNLNIPSSGFVNMLKAAVEILPNNRYSIIQQDVRTNAILDVNPGFIFYDICQFKEAAIAIKKIINHYDNTAQKIIIIVDDAVRKHESNQQFFETWHHLWTTQKPSHFKPFLITGNRLFLSNYDIDEPFRLSLYTFEKFNYYQKSIDISHPYNGYILRNSQFGIQKTTKSKFFLENDAFWNEIKDYFNAVDFTK